MKTFDLKSLIIGVLLTMMVVVVMLIATSNGTPVAWEYQVLHPVHGGPALQNWMNSAGNDGWEVVSVGTDNQNGSFVVMKRAKSVQRPSWWRFWKK